MAQPPQSVADIIRAMPSRPVPAGATPPVGAAPAAEPAERGVLMTVLDYLNRPSRAIAGAAMGAMTAGDSAGGRALENLTGARQDDFDDVLAYSGIEDTGVRRGAGLALDIATDPLNFIAPVKMLKAAGAATGATKGLRKMGDALADTRVGDMALRLKDDLGEKFVPFYGLAKFKTTVDEGTDRVQQLSYQDLRRLHASRLDHVREAVGQKVLTTFKGLNTDDAYQVSLALDEGRKLADPRLEALRAAAEGQFREQFEKEVAAGVLEPGSRLADYVTHLMVKDGAKLPRKFRALNAKNPFRDRKDITLRQGVEAGVFEPDIRRIAAGRLAKGDQSIANARFFEDAAQHFGVAAKGAPDHYATVKLAADAPIKAAMRDVRFPPEIAADLEKMIALPDAAGPLADMASKFTALWKGYATRANPGFHGRNAVSNMVQAWFAGVGDTAGKVFDPLAVGTAHAKAARHVADHSTIGKLGNYDGDEIRQALGEYGILSGHQTSFNELSNVIDDEVAHAGKNFFARNLNPVDKGNVLLRGGAAVGNAIENTSRMAVFLDQLEKGASLERAALHVRKYLFDYSELTPFEQKIRDRALPFYTWLRKNLPLQIDTLINQPQKVGAFGKLENAISDTTEDRGLAVDPQSIPEWMHEFVQLPFLTDKGTPVMANADFPINDLNTFNPTLDNARQVGLAGLNPLVRVPLELATNQQFFDGRPVYDDRIGMRDDMRMANPLVEGAHNLAPGLTSALTGAVRTDRGVEMPTPLDYLMRQAPPVSQMGRVAKVATRDEADSPGKIGGISPELLQFLGVNTRPIDPEAARRTRVQRRRDMKAQIQARRREGIRISKGEAQALLDSVQ
jgi:hypothetical protein